MNDNNNNINDELDELSPFLSKLHKSKKQEVLPKNYFENFEDRLMSRIHEEEALTPTSRKTSVHWWEKLSALFTPKYAAGFSMAIVLIIGAVFVFDNNSNNPVQENLLAELTIEEANNYIVNHIEDFSTEEILASLDIEEIKKVEHLVPTIQQTTVKTTSSTTKTAMEKAIEATGGETILDDLKAEDFEEELEDLF